MNQILGSLNRSTLSSSILSTLRLSEINVQSTAHADYQQDEFDEAKNGTTKDPAVMLINAGEWRGFGHLCRERFEIDCVLGYAKIGKGYILLGTATTDVEDMPEILEIQDILVMPLEYEAALKAIKKHKKKTGVIGRKKRRLSQMAKRKHEELAVLGEHLNVLKGADFADKVSSSEDDEDEDEEENVKEKDEVKVASSGSEGNIDNVLAGTNHNKDQSEKRVSKDSKNEKCKFWFGRKSVEKAEQRCRPLVGQQNEKAVANDLCGYSDTFSSQKDSDMETLRETEPLLSIKSKKTKRNSRKGKKRLRKAMKDEQRRIERKFCKETRRIFKQGGFYLSWEADIWRGSLKIDECTGHLCTEEKDPSLEHKEPEFLWNKHLLEPFGELEKPESNPRIVAKVVRGFVGAVNMRVVDNKQKERLGKMIIVSRRSAKRNGMRYLRRGIDDKGHVANFVETTQIVALMEDKSTHIHQGAHWSWFSYKILRGSIPVFFYQDPSKLQPRPEVQRSISENREKFKRHFEHLRDIYGEESAITCISLVDKCGKEREVGKLYEKLAQEQNIPFVWFDFHKECAGLQFGNVAKLYEDDTVKSTAERQKYLSSVGDTQNGMFRINCIDCLDRTNIVVKSICERVLKKQLCDQKLKLAEAQSFRHRYLGIWANQGDYLSSQYASTNAMKGDFTRNEKRRYTGVVNDGIISLVRFYHGFVTDYYTQVVIDFLLGNEQSDVFERYDSVLDNFDPNAEREKELVQTLRAEKIAKSVSNMYSEEIIGVWWILVNKKDMDPFDLGEGLLVLTSRNAIIDCPKASGDEFGGRMVAEHQIWEIPLEDVRLVKYGSYYTDVRSRHARRPSRNMGCELVWGPSSKPSRLRLRFPSGWRKNRKKSMLKLLMKVLFNSSFIHCDIVDLQSAQKHTAVWDLISYRLRRLIWG